MSPKKLKSRFSESANSKNKNGHWILDAAIDQNGERWIKYGNSSSGAWFSISELIASEQKVFDKLSGADVTLLTTRSRNSFKAQVESPQRYRKALVATNPGWLGTSAFLHGDATLTKCGSADTEIIVAISPHPKFSPKGSLRGWQKGVGPIVAHQSLPLTILCAGLVGPLLAYAPPDVTNPFFELYGDPLTAKSTLCCAAGSMWAGRSEDSELGGAVSWEATLAAGEALKELHSGTALVLDEGNLAGASLAAAAEKVVATIFKMERPGGKLRYRETRSIQSRLPVFSTTNTSLRELLPISPNREAVLSRVVSIPVSERGILDFIPAGWTSRRDAAEHLAAVIDANSAVVGREFVNRVFAPQNEQLQRLIPVCIGCHRWLIRRRWPMCTPRIEKALAMTMTAGYLARQTDIFPSSWGDLNKAIFTVLDRIMVGGTPSADAIKRYYRCNAKRIVNLAELESPLPFKTFQSHPGVFQQAENGRIHLIVPSPQLQRAVNDHENVVRALRNQGQARTEGGKKKKLTKKAPKAYCNQGRVYWFVLPEAELNQKGGKRKSA